MSIAFVRLTGPVGPVGPFRQDVAHGSGRRFPDVVGTRPERAPKVALWASTFAAPLLISFLRLATVIDLEWSALASVLLWMGMIVAKHLPVYLVATVPLNWIVRKLWFRKPPKASDVFGVAGGASVLFVVFFYLAPNEHWLPFSHLLDALSFVLGLIVNVLVYLGVCASAGWSKPPLKAVAAA